MTRRRAGPTCALWCAEGRRCFVGYSRGVCAWRCSPSIVTPRRTKREVLPFKCTRVYALLRRLVRLGVARWSVVAWVKLVPSCSVGRPWFTHRVSSAISWEYCRLGSPSEGRISEFLEFVARAVVGRPSRPRLPTPERGEGGAEPFLCRARPKSLLHLYSEYPWVVEISGWKLGLGIYTCYFCVRARPPPPFVPRSGGLPMAAVVENTTTVLSVCVC